MKTVYINPFRKHKFDSGRNSAFFLCKVDKETEGHSAEVIYMNEWESQGGE